MSVIQTITKLSVGAQGKPLGSTLQYAGNFEANLSQSVPVGVNTEYVYGALPKAGIQKFFMVSSEPITVYWNAPGTGSPALTVVLAAGVPYMWDTGCGFANPFPTSTTALYITNASGSAAQFDIGCVANI
jgi:hypothetical protein